MQFLEGGGGHLPQMPHPGSATDIYLTVYALLHHTLIVLVFTMYLLLCYLHHDD